MARTANHSIRFDEDKLAFFKKKNPTVEKPQDIVDYFLDEFWWKHNGKWITKEEADQMPTNGRQYTKQQEDKIDEPENKEKTKKGVAPDPSNKAAYLKWLKEN